MSMTAHSLIVLGGWEEAFNQVSERASEQASEIETLKAGIIKLGAYALTKRPYVDPAATKVQLRKDATDADESLRQVGIKAKNLLSVAKHNA